MFSVWCILNFQVSWLSFSYNVVKMLSVYVCVSVCLHICLDVNQGGTNRNRCRQRLVILHIQTGLLMISDYTPKTTLCLKKVPTFKLSATLSNLNRFSKFLHSWKMYEICYKTMRQYPPHLGHVATLPWELKIRIFCKYSADMGKCKETAFSVHRF